MSNPEDQTSMIIMNNYFGIGIDADVCLKFHNKVSAFVHHLGQVFFQIEFNNSTNWVQQFNEFQRDANPEKFQSRLFNKTQYVKIGLQKVFFERTCKDLWKRIEVEVDGKVSRFSLWYSVSIVGIFNRDD